MDASRVRAIRNPIRKFIRRGKPDIVYLLLKPDPSARNFRTEEIAKLVSSFWVAPSVTWSLEGKTLVLPSKDRFSFRIVYQHGEVSFLLAIPRRRLSAFRNRLESLWERITIDEVGMPPYLDASKSAGAHIHYLRHDFFAIHTDHKNNAPLSSLISPIREFQAGDIAIMDILLEPTNRVEWEHKARAAAHKLRQGRMPVKVGAVNVAEKGFELFNEGMNAIRYTLLEMTAFTKEQEAALKQQKKREQMDINALRMLRDMSGETKKKQTAEVLKVSMRAVVQSEDVERRLHLLQNITGAWHDLDGDNELTASPAQNVQRLIWDIDRQRHGRKLVMSTDEVGKLVQLPGDELQKAYKEINAVRKVEVQVSNEIFMDVPGITLGAVTEKGVTRNARVPLVPYTIQEGGKEKEIRQKDVYDALCTPVFSFGKMGVGKTESVGGNQAIDMIKAGYTAFVLDTADGNIGKVITDALPADYPEEKIIYLDFRNVKQAIPITYADVAESLAGGAHGDDAELEELQVATRLTAHLQELVNEQSSTGELKDRMLRYFTSAAKATRGRPLYIKLALESPAYREELLNDPFVQSQPDVVADLMVLQQKALTGADRAIVDPILDRLKMIERNPFLANVFLSDDKRDENGELLLNFRKFADNPEGGYGYCVVIVCNKETYGAEGQELICATIQSKIFLAAYSRGTMDQDARKPFVSIADEPHRFIRSGAAKRLYSDAAVELRKYRCRVVMLAHSPAQLGDVWEAFGSGGSQIIAYKSENMNDYNRIAQQLSPYDTGYVYDNLAEKWEAVCKLRLPSGNESPAFFCKMAVPPEAVKGKDRSKRREECGKQFGIHWKEALNRINELRAKYLELDAEWQERKVQEVEEAKEADKERKKAEREVQKVKS